MKIAILSGKGGTGKTTIAVNLAQALHNNVSIVDLDVEEPNAKIFFPQRIQSKSPVYVDIPEIDLEKCTLCGRCTDFCHFNALIKTSKKILLMEELCHNCAGCHLVCPENCINNTKKEIGLVNSFSENSFHFTEGRLNIGYPVAGALIRKAKEIRPEADIIIYDCPPGSSCSVVESLKNIDFAILVAEPTPFGFHDFQIVEQLIQKIKIPYGVIINKETGKFPALQEHIRQKNVPLLLTIPYQEDIAQTCSSGRLLVDDLPEYKHIFHTVIKKIKAYQ